TATTGLLIRRGVAPLEMGVTTSEASPLPLKVVSPSRKGELSGSTKTAANAPVLLAAIGWGPPPRVRSTGAPESNASLTASKSRTRQSAAQTDRLDIDEPRSHSSREE